MKTVITGLMAFVWSLGLHAQVADTAAVAPEVMPIESPELHGAREATEEEKAMARELARDQRNQQQTRFLRYDANGFTQLDSLTVKIHEPAETPAEDYYMPEYPLYALSHGFAPWELHKGLNVNLGASVSAGFGSGAVGGAAFTQDVNLMYVTQLSPKASLAVGGYLSNTLWNSSNYTVAGLTAMLNYRFNEHWSAYAFVQKAFTSGNISPWRAVYPFGHYGGYYGMGAWGRPVGYWALDSRMMDRFGAGVRYDFNNHSFIQIQVEVDRVPTGRTGFYNHNRYDYPVR